MNTKLYKLLCVLYWKTRPRPGATKMEYIHQRAQFNDSYNYPLLRVFAIPAALPSWYEVYVIYKYGVRFWSRALRTVFSLVEYLMSSRHYTSFGTRDEDHKGWQLPGMLQASGGRGSSSCAHAAVSLTLTPCHSLLDLPVVQEVCHAW